MDDLHRQPPTEEEIAEFKKILAACDGLTYPEFGPVRDAIRENRSLASTNEFLDWGLKNHKELDGATRTKSENGK